MISNLENSSLILKAFDRDAYPKEKMAILFSALCVMVYDAEQKQSDSSCLVGELNKRMDLVKKYSHLIDDYIAAVVFPKLGLR